MKNLKQIQAEVAQVTPLTDSIIELVLSPNQFIDYLPGQYLQVHCAGEILSYSIANAPLGSHKYELHIRHDKGNPYNQPLFAQIKQQGKIAITLPHGDCHINRLQADKPILFLAGGTGFAPTKSIIEYLLATGDSRNFALFWGARSQSDLYREELVKSWQSHVSHFHYCSLLSGNAQNNLATMAIEHYKQTLLNYQVVISGPFEMVYALRDSLVAFGMPGEQIFSDAFSFETKGD